MKEASPESIYDPAVFRSTAHELADLLADYLERYRQPSDSLPVFDYTPPNELYQYWAAELGKPSTGSVSELLSPFLRQMMHLHHPRYMGHQTSVVAPLAALAELMGSLLDPGMGVYEQGTAGVVLERLLCKELAVLAGWPDGADGFLTSGGTLGNLTALLCARQVKARDDIWQNGYGARQYAFMASAQAHYSVDRAIRVMGLGECGLLPVPVNQHFQMDTDQLEAVFQRAANEGITVLGVVANACTTATGSYDPIGPVADFCEANDLWLHVDGAHGAGVLFSQEHRHLLSGIERADSFILDFHKMLLSPKLVTAVVFRNGQHSWQTFAQKASYLWDADEEKEWYHLGKRTFELTKSFMSIRLYVLWKVYGKEGFAANVDRLHSLAQCFNRLLHATTGFETALPVPQSNILCFRYREPLWSEERADKVNAEVRRLLVEQGQFFIVQTRIGDRLYLRTTLMNPFTKEKDLKALLEVIKRLASHIT